MKRKSMIVAALAATTLHAADDLSSMFSEGKVSGQIRAFHIDRSDNTKADNQVGTAVGGKLLFETASLNGLSFGTGFYTTNRIFTGLEEAAMGPNTTLFQNDGSSYAILGEAYLNYKSGATNIKVGRQKLDTPLAGSDDTRMIPNLFEAYVVSNQDIKDTTLILAHVSQIAPGTFSNAYAGGVVGATAGYSYIAGNMASFQGKFVNMGEWAVGQKTDGVTAAAVITKTENMTLQLWDYYAHDILNAVYAQGDFKWKCRLSDAVKPFAALQAIQESNTGDKFAGEVDSTYYGVKAGAAVGGFKAYVAYSEQSSNEIADAVTKGATITAWGGMPAFTQGMVTRHQFLAGTKATKMAATYNMKDQGVNVSATAYYAMFEMDANSGYGTERTVYEPGFDVIYYPAAVKNLQLRLRGNFPNEFTNSRSWDEYRFITNYSF